MNIFDKGLFLYMCEFFTIPSLVRFSSIDKEHRVFLEENCKRLIKWKNTDYSSLRTMGEDMISEIIMNDYIEFIHRYLNGRNLYKQLWISGRLRARYLYTHTKMQKNLDIFTMCTISIKWGFGDQFIVLVIDQLKQSQKDKILDIYWANRRIHINMSNISY